MKTTPIKTLQSNPLHNLLAETSKHSGRHPWHYLLLLLTFAIHRTCIKFFDGNRTFAFNEQYVDFSATVVDSSIARSDKDLLKKQIARTLPHTLKAIPSKRFAAFMEKHIFPKSLNFGFARAQKVCSLVRPYLELSHHKLTADLSIACLGCRDELEVHFTRRYFSVIAKTKSIGVDLVSQSKSVILGDMLNLPFSDAEHQVVIASHSLEHVSDLNLALSEIKRVLAVDGFTGIEVPCGWSGKLVSKDNIVSTGNDVDLWDFGSVEAVCRLIENSGLRVLAHQEDKSAKRCRIVATKIA